MSAVGLRSVGGSVAGAAMERNRIKSAADMDEDRAESAAYEYLCHLQEAKQWIEECIKEELPPTTSLEENFRNGVYFAKVGHFCAPRVVPVKRIFDVEQTRWRSDGLHFKHTDNINYFLNALREIGLPPIFLPETTDIYDMKNMPRAVFCIHALSLYMFKLGSAPQIQDLYGRVEFSEADISTMEEQLSRSGVDMPKFRNLGRMLADPGGGDTGRMAQAVNTIVNCVAKADERLLLSSLTNPGAGLQQVKPGHVRQYLMVLQEARAEKHSGLLSQPEIQGHITRVNLVLALERVVAAVRTEDPVTLGQALATRELALDRHLNTCNMDLYLTHLIDCVDVLGPGDLLRRDTILGALEAANDLGREQQGVETAMMKLNLALRSGRPLETLAALHQPTLRLGAIVPDAAELYHNELQFIQSETGADLTYEGVCMPVQFLSAVAAVTIAALDGDTAGVWRHLVCPDIAIQDLDIAASAQYVAEIIRLARSKSTVLTHGDLQLAVDKVNSSLAENLGRLGAVQAVNDALARQGRGLWDALQSPGLGLQGKIDREDEIKYLETLKCYQASHTNMETGGVLWWEHIAGGVGMVQTQVEQLQSVAGVLRGLNSAVMTGDKLGVWNYLSNNCEILGLSGRPRAELVEDYLEALKKELDKRAKTDGGHTWVKVMLSDGSKAWVEVEGGRHSWTQPSLASHYTCTVLNVEEVRLAVESVAGMQLSAVNLDRLVRLQARCRGWLCRNRMFAMLDWYYRHEASLVKVQALWRGKLARKRLALDITRMLKENQVRQTTKYNQLTVSSALKIQRWWRSVRTKRRSTKSWEAALSCPNPSLITVVEHIHLLDVRDSDFREELELSGIRGELSKLIRANEQLEKKLDEMDVKIGLLVQNRISVQDVMGEGQKRGSTAKRGGGSEAGAEVGTHRGLKALKKESHDRLVAYQHLFYMLQTDPNYLARLMFAMPQSRTTKFLESVILTLYNFGGNAREEFLLLRLFKTALVEEVMTKVEKVQDVVVGNPLVVKLVVSYNRSGRGVYGLKELVGPRVRQVLEDTKLKINTNPVEVYKSWINQVESESGQPAGLPYDVSQDEALAHEEVQKRLAKSITDLKRMTTLFLATIINGIDKFPYGILYCAKVLFGALQQKFPTVQEKELLKVVGNLVYYRFVNPTIVAPERFDMMDKKVDLNLNNDQRRNLGSIAKILQFAASKKGFGEESEHLMCLNPFIIECHEKFKSFFVACCNVQEPEVQFNIDQYTEAVLIVKPSIYISLAELCDTHQLLLDHRESVAPLPCDPLHPILSSLGPPSLCSLLGAADSDNDSSLSSLGKTEVCLTLSPSTDSFNSSSSDTEKLWVKTKHLLLAILPAVFAHGEKHRTLIGSLKSRTTPEQEMEYCSSLDKRELASDQADSHEGLDMTNVFFDEEGRLPLEDAKRLVLKNLRILEVAGLTSSKDGCQSILSDIARDILNQRDHRLRRHADMMQAERVRAGLENKQKYMEVQLEQYRQYVTHCLANLNRAGNNRRVHFSTHHENIDKERKVRSKAALKYAATKLQEKGVLQSIGELPANQLKNVQFIFLPLEQDGLFEVSARFMGVDMERVVLDIQELLRLQYEEQAVINLFGKAKVNVNLLLHFLNAKFYGK